MTVARRFVAGLLSWFSAPVAESQWLRSQKDQSESLQYVPSTHPALFGRSKFVEQILDRLGRDRHFVSVRMNV